MEPLSLSMNRLALDLRVPVTRIAEIVTSAAGLLQIRHCGSRGTSIPALSFGLNLQSAYDLEIAQDKLWRVIEPEVRPASLAAADASS
jgi:plasmid maintenance system antidote protein VapI